jgi:signal transduction histidine kinase
MPLKRELIDLGEVAQSVTQELQLANPDRSIEFHRQGNAVGYWDHDRVAQVVSNLVGNAIRHGRDPITAAVVEDGDCVEIRVSNHGARIPQDIIPSLFEPYRRATESENGGLGLGLFIVAEIVRAHTGTVSVGSNDEGTVFAVRLPKKPPSAEQLSSVAPESQDSALPT